MTQPAKETNGNGKAGAIASVLTSANTDSFVKLGTLALVVLSGGTNFFATKNTGSTNSEEILRANHEIHELYLSLERTSQRQERALATMDRVEQKLDQLKRSDAGHP